MTDGEIYDAGMEAFRRWCKNVPPYSIASIRRDSEAPSAVRIWHDGWSHAKAIVGTEFSSWANQGLPSGHPDKD